VIKDFVSLAQPFPLITPQGGRREGVIMGFWVVG
jgi:hypothetical protein